MKVQYAELQEYWHQLLIGRSRGLTSRRWGMRSVIEVRTPKVSGTNVVSGWFIGDGPLSISPMANADDSVDVVFNPEIRGQYKAGRISACHNRL